MRGTVTGTAIAGLIALAAAGCAAVAVSARPVPAPHLSITPANGTRGVAPGAPVTVLVTHGKVRDVTVTRAGVRVPGTLGPGGVWRSREPLAVSTTYTVTATAVGAGHKVVTGSVTFRTFTPRKTFHASIFEASGQQYGVGMPIMLTFSRPIRDRAAVERAIQLRTSRPVVGAWSWQGDRSLVFRPRSYWPQYTTVTVDGMFSGVQAAPGVYGRRDLHATFSIGPSLIVVASTVSHYMDVYYKYRLLGRWAISTGRPGMDTPDGTYLTIFKNNPQFMTGPGYALWVPWAVDITDSGVFIHDAYWSVAEQGITNVSHGCINTSPAHAETYYKLEEPGDPATVTGSPVAGTPGDGWTEWFLSWPQWLAGSATGDAVVAGPGGSRLVSPSALPSAHGRAPLWRPRNGNSRAD
jgi:lipoprotein-anchoring transpeptidase ErfK/SrfK